MKLIIAEKPSVAKDIARVLQVKQLKDGYIEGGDTVVTWAFGHLIQLVNPEHYSPDLQHWKMDTLPMIPDIFQTQIVESPSSKKQYHVIESFLKNPNLTEVICATDAGREGELIFRHIYAFSGCTAPIKRLWISSQTDQAVKDGFANLKDGKVYEPLYHSAISRSQADWLVGMNATRAYTIACSRGQGVMSVGRVQTPVLKMIVDRYRVNMGFQADIFYEIIAEFSHANGQYTGTWINDKKETRIDQKNSAESLLETLQKATEGSVSQLTQKEKKEKQPLLYDLTELQRDANKKYKYSADDTLKIAQALYERHKVLTYPRTSSRFLSKDMSPKLPELIGNLKEQDAYKLFAEQILSKKLSPTKRIIDDAKVTDHHAIIPTEKKAVLSQLSEQERNIYDLVIRRFLAVFLDECVKDHTEIITQVATEFFRSSGTVIRIPGWRAVYLAPGSENDSEGDEGSLLPKVQKGDTVGINTMEIREGKTAPPPLFNEASILSAMETAGKQVDDEELREAMKDCGLGTPATRAQILERLIQVGYIVREKNRLLPTPKGEQIIDSIQDEALLSPELTGAWEKKLNDMAQGKFSREDYMQQIVTFTKNMIENVKNGTMAPAKIEGALGECPICGASVIETKLSYGCSNWKTTQCSFVIWKELAGKAISPKMAKVLLTKGKTDVIKGFKTKAGKKFDSALVIQNGKAVFDFSQEFGECPICKEGKVIATPKAYSCSKWKETGCQFVIWKSVAGRDLTEAEVKQLLTDGKTGKLTGFKSRAGNAFEAVLVMQNGKVGFEF